MERWESDERGTFAATPDGHAYRLAKAALSGRQDEWEHEMSRREICGAAYFPEVTWDKSRSFADKVKVEPL